ncbi:MAG: hypothetical protein WDM76_14440 [Limisphaerales bacterium]
MAGSFSGTNYFGGTNLVSRGNTDALLLKYDSTGTLLWRSRQVAIMWMVHPALPWMQRVMPIC